MVRGVDVTIHLSNQITNLSQLMLDYGQWHYRVPADLDQTKRYSAGTGWPYSSELAVLLGSTGSGRFVLTPANSGRIRPVPWNTSSSAPLRPSASVPLRWPYSRELAVFSRNWPPFGQNGRNPIFWGLTQIWSKMMDFGDFVNLEQNDCYVAAKILDNFKKKQFFKKYVFLSSFF